MDTQTPFAAPVVDELSVRVVVDSFYERFLPKAEHDHVAVEHIGRVPGRHLSTFACEWGLSLHLSSVADGAKAQYMLDFGFTPEIINRNFDLLDIDPAQIDGLILSHGHRDHFGGMAGFIDHYRSHMRPDLALYVGGETVFREKWVKEKGQDALLWGAVDRGALKAHNVAPVCCPTPHALAGAFTSGYIERTSFEKVSGGSLVEEDDDHFSEEERQGKLVLDQHPDEHATCYIVKGRGLVVISSCGHTGIVNTVRTAMAISGVDKLHAVLGGFHLGLAPPDYIEHTVDALADMAPDVIVPMHCTGTNFITAMKERMPGHVVASNVGSRFTFGV